MSQYRRKPKTSVTLPPEVLSALNTRGANVSGVLSALAKVYCGIETDAKEKHVLDEFMDAMKSPTAPENETETDRRIHAIEKAISRIGEVERILSALHNEVKEIREKQKNEPQINTANIMAANKVFVGGRRRNKQHDSKNENL